MRIDEIMEKNRKTVATSDDPERALEIMRSEGLEVLPVVENDGEVVGLLWRSRLEQSPPENKLDEAVEETFPASDPISPA